MIVIIISITIIKQTFTTAYCTCTNIMNPGNFSSYRCIDVTINYNLEESFVNYNVDQAVSNIQDLK